jgi:HD-GYP domain-containing protein (c-di-GMP phosphodiesterase class II)
VITRSHLADIGQKRVCLYSIEIARALSCSEPQIRIIARGACLHYIGKLAIPDRILLKPGPLSEDEWRIMQTHVIIGYHLVNRISFMADAAEIVFSHHERHDGSGYPRGLRGNQIALGARIFSIADTVDAMTSDRPYRAARPFHIAWEEIQRETGRKFDPQVANPFLQIPTETWNGIRLQTANDDDFRTIPFDRKI